MPKGVKGSGKGAHTKRSGIPTARQERERERAVTAAPHEDPDLAANRMADQARGVYQPPPKPPPPAYVVGDDDPEIAASKLAVRLIQEEQRRAEAARAARPVDSRQSLREQALGRIPVEMLIGQPDLPDPMRMEDDDGTPLLGPGECGRWVRVKDDLDQKNENSLRVRRLKQGYGAVPVMKADGTPLRTETLVAMKLSIDQNARRIIHASRSGAFDAVKPLDDLHNEADRVNREYSKRHHGASQGVIQVAPVAGYGNQHGQVNPFAPAEE